MMKVNMVTGLDPEMKAEQQEHYGWWTMVDAEPECKGFDFSVYFPNGPLPAISFQLWSVRVQIGWFF